MEVITIKAIIIVVLIIFYHNYSSATIQKEVIVSQAQLVSYFKKFFREYLSFFYFVLLLDLDRLVDSNFVD